MSQKQRSLLFICWHFLIIGMLTALFVTLVVIYSFKINQFYQEIFGTFFIFILPAALFVGTISAACHLFLRSIQQGHVLPIVIAVVLVIWALCVSQGWMSFVFLPLLLECLILFKIEQALDKRVQVKRKNSL